MACLSVRGSRFRVSSLLFSSSREEGARIKRWYKYFFLPPASQLQLETQHTVIDRRLLLPLVFTLLDRVSLNTALFRWYFLNTTF